MILITAIVILFMAASTGWARGVSSMPDSVPIEYSFSSSVLPGVKNLIFSGKRLDFERPLSECSKIRNKISSVIRPNSRHELSERQKVFISDFFDSCPREFAQMEILDGIYYKDGSLGGYPLCRHINIPKGGDGKLRSVWVKNDGELTRHMFGIDMNGNVIDNLSSAYADGSAKIVGDIGYVNIKDYKIKSFNVKGSNITGVLIMMIYTQELLNLMKQREIRQ